MKLLNLTSDPNECWFFFFKDRVGKPIYIHLLLKIKVFPENMGIGLDKKKQKKYFFFHFGGSVRNPPTWDPPKNRKMCQLEAFIVQSIRHLEIFCLSPLKSPWQDLFRTLCHISVAVLFSKYSMFVGPSFRL